MMEMLILLRLDPTDMKALKQYRIQVKERLYRFNFVSSLPDFRTHPAEPFIQEALSQIDKEERLQKLEETFQSVKEDYQRILAMV